MSYPKASSAPTFRQALEACRAFLRDPEGFADVFISGPVWVRDGVTLLGMVEAALNDFDTRVRETSLEGGDEAPARAPRCAYCGHPANSGPCQRAHP